jgi:hypothetical protein
MRSTKHNSAQRVRTTSRNDIEELRATFPCNVEKVTLSRIHCNTTNEEVHVFVNVAVYYDEFEMSAL